MTKFDTVVSVRERVYHVTGTVTPAEPSTWSEWDGGSPGCSACIEDALIFLVLGKRERELHEHSIPTGAQVEAWDNFYRDIEEAVFESLDS